MKPPKDNTAYKLEQLRLRIDDLIYKYWVALPEPKCSYTHYWYRNGGLKDMLDYSHLDGYLKHKPGWDKITSRILTTPDDDPEEAPEKIQDRNERMAEKAEIEMIALRERG